MQTPSGAVAGSSHDDVSGGRRYTISACSEDDAAGDTSGENSLLRCGWRKRVWGPSTPQEGPLRGSSCCAQDDKVENSGRCQHNLLDFASKSHRKGCTGVSL